MTQSEENYIKTIFLLEEAGKGKILTNAIAEKLETKASSVTDMIQKLEEKGIVTYKKYQGVNLTSAGKRAALALVRKHRLWETFLVNRLNFGWDEVHEIAHQLEHIQSESLVEKLDAFLGFPETDPHGEPIPGGDGKVQLKTPYLINLSEAKPGEKYILEAVLYPSDVFLRYLNKVGLGIGSELQVQKIEDYDLSMEILILGNSCFLSNETTQNLMVKHYGE
ncbi:MAG: metal-dependent transcriptional regulator [Bacteroidales bacterium]|nr:metal-dependent transcriptional regulator [Bacteroidales bacterium]